VDDYLIRPMEPKDLERVLGIISRHDESDENEAREFFRDYYNNSPVDPAKCRHYVVEIEDDLVGVGGYIVPENRDEFEIAFLFVDPYYQGQKLGTRLLKRVCNDVRSLGAEHLLVPIDPEDIPSQAIKFYEINGFSPIKPGAIDTKTKIYYRKNL